jgi:signal transduction histidine kinase
VADHYADAAERKKFIDRLRRDGRVTNMELTLLKMDKSPIRVLMSAALVQGEPGEGDIIEGTFIDITEKEALSSERAKARELQGIAQLTAGIAHEVRNPLFAIQLNLAGLVRRLSLGETEQTQVDFVLSHVKRLDSLVRSLLELGQSVEPEEMIETDLRTLIKEACITVEEEFPPRTGQIDVGVHETPVFVRVSPRKITQAFVHLLRNAVQVTPEGGAVHIRCDHDASGCRVLISDGGPGIPGKIRKSLFEPFVTTRTGQPGMGLALARHYIESHGGTIKAVNNKPPPGATFAAWLPTTGTLRDSGGNKLPLTG